MAKIADAFSLIRNGANIKQGLDDSGYPITRIETISDRTVDRDKMGYAGITDITKYSDYVLQDGDILMSHINSETHLGKVARYEKYEGETIIHGMNLLCLRPNKNLVDSRYAFYYLSSEAFLHQIPRITKKSVNQASFNVAALKELTFPISSMEVQQPVADILDKANELIALRKEQLAKLDELVKARFVELFGDPERNPKKWPVVSITEIIRGKVSNGFFAKRDAYRNDGNVQVLGVANIVNRMYSNIEGLPRTNATQAEKEKYRVKYGDMLFCRSSLVAEGIGKASIVPQDTPQNVLFECHVIRLPLDQQKCVPEFVQALSTTPYFRKQIIAQSKTATMTTIGQDGILKAAIILPPVELQQEFLRFVEQTDKSKVAVQKALDEAQLLFDSLMQKYFE